MKEIIQPATGHLPKGAWSQGIRVGNLLFVAGQVGEDQAGVIRNPSDIKEQAAQAFANIQAVVEQGGGKLGDIVKITAFLTDRANFAGYDSARRAFFGKDFPASTTVVVQELVDPDYLVEVEAIAVLST